MSLAQGIANATEAMRRVESGANEEWKTAMFQAIENLCLTRAEFTGDDCFAEIAKIAPSITTPDKRALGPLLVRARKQGLCFQTGRFSKTEASDAHAHDQKIWASTFFEQARDVFDDTAEHAFDVLHSMLPGTIANSIDKVRAEICTALASEFRKRIRNDNEMEFG